MINASISDEEFKSFRDLIYQRAGISLSPAKKMLVSGRLAKRLKEHNLQSYGDYLNLLLSGKNAAEMQIAVDLLTTNETHFFREPKHFDYLREKILPTIKPGRHFRIWSAACSTGEEPYSLAMLLSERLGDSSWEILASDISTRVLQIAQQALYPISKASEIPTKYLSNYCLKGVGKQAGSFLIERKLRTRVSFMQINLNTTLPKLAEFDVIFLRNVMIYFENETKRQVVSRLVSLLKPEGYLIIGHSETLNDITCALKSIIPTVYRKPS